MIDPSEKRRRGGGCRVLCARAAASLVVLAACGGALLGALRLGELGAASPLRATTTAAAASRTPPEDAVAAAASAAAACDACDAVCRPQRREPAVACPSTPPPPPPPSCPPAVPASAAAAPCALAVGGGGSGAADPRRRGLERLLTDDDLDTFFRVEAELHDHAFGTADVTFLAPYLARVAGAHRAERGAGAGGTGGVVDVGANIGGATDAMLSHWSDHSMRFYLHVAGSDDSLHSAYSNERLAFAFALEAAPKTLALLRRRAEAARWANSNVRIFEAAASNASGTARFCSSAAGSEQGGVELQAAAKDGGACAVVEAVTVADLVDREALAGPAARVFFLKIDVEGGEALVLAGAERLFAQQRVSYVLFENHAKWSQAQEAVGFSPFVGVGDAVRALAAHGYRCFYLHSRGLVPFASRGTPAGDAARPVSDCHEGLPFCARWRLYNRQFWSNIFCGARSESAWLDWIADAAVSPTETRDKLLRRS
jgi:FkbM family methyltransferase